MKNIKTPLLVLALLANTGIFAKEKAVIITTTAFIKAPITEIYDLVTKYSRFTEWSPFLVTDPQQKNHVSGVDGAMNSEFHWEGVEEKSVGYQKITALKQEDYIRMDCYISVPYDTHSIFEYKLNEKNGGVEVVQTFTMNLSIFSRFMIRIFGTKKKMEQTNELGLKRLQNVAEGIDVKSL